MAAPALLAKQCRSRDHETDRGSVRSGTGAKGNGAQRCDSGAQAMAIALKSGIDPAMIIKTVANGSGASTQFGIRAPWMAERRFMPQQGSAPGLAHYLEHAKELADEVGVATPLLDCLIDIFHEALPQIGDRDVAAIIERFEKSEQTSTHGKH